MFEPVVNKGEGDFLGNQYYRNFISKSGIKIMLFFRKKYIAKIQRFVLRAAIGDTRYRMKPRWLPIPVALDPDEKNRGLWTLRIYSRFQPCSNQL